MSPGLPAVPEEPALSVRPSNSRMTLDKVALVLNLSYNSPMSSEDGKPTDHRLPDIPFMEGIP